MGKAYCFDRTWHPLSNALGFSLEMLYTEARQKDEITPVLSFFHRIYLYISGYIVPMFN